MWLGAALTYSTDRECSTITPTIKVSEDLSWGPIIIYLSFRMTTFSYPGFSTVLESTCWHAMFRHPVIVDGFPIPARHENERGLEIPLDMMSTLAEAHFATVYNSTLILKGLCTMLVPTRQTKDSISWHFLFNENGDRIPYYAFRERCGRWIDTDKVNTKHVEAGDVRHFVGWTSNITRHLGMLLASSPGSKED